MKNMSVGSALLLMIALPLVNANCKGLAWNERFDPGASSFSSQCQNWKQFRAKINGYYDSIRISGSYDMWGIKCTDPEKATLIAEGLKSGSTFSIMCDGHEWSVCDRYDGELWIGPPSVCSNNNCPNPGYIIRPCIGNSNIGGVNTATCGFPSQWMEVALCQENQRDRTKPPSPSSLTTSCSRESTVWSDHFPEGGLTDSAQCNDWTDFRYAITGAYGSIRVSGSYDPTGIECTDPSKVAQIATALRFGMVKSVTCDGHEWTVCTNEGVLLWIDPPSLCSNENCPYPGYIIRPCSFVGIPHGNGVNSLTCPAPEQSIQVELCRSPPPPTTPPPSTHNLKLSCSTGSHYWNEFFPLLKANTQSQCDSWNDFRKYISGNYQSIRMSGTYSNTGISCSDPAKATQIAVAIKANVQLNVTCDGHVWTVCKHKYPRVWIDPPSLCSYYDCPNPGYIVRPCIGNENVGGVNTGTCRQDRREQSLQIELCRPSTTAAPSVSAPTRAPSVSAPTRAPTAVPTTVPSFLPTHSPSLDPCLNIQCSTECSEALNLEGIKVLCGWDSESSLCRTGFRTSQDEIDRKLEAIPGACSHLTNAPTTQSPTTAPVMPSANTNVDSSGTTIAVSILVPLLVLSLIAMLFILVFRSRRNNSRHAAQSIANANSVVNLAHSVDNEVTVSAQYEPTPPKFHSVYKQNEMDDDLYETVPAKKSNEKIQSFYDNDQPQSEVSPLKPDVSGLPTDDGLDGKEKPQYDQASTESEIKSQYLEVCPDDSTV